MKNRFYRITCPCCGNKLLDGTEIKACHMRCPKCKGLLHITIIGNEVHIECREDGEENVVMNV